MPRLDSLMSRMRNLRNFVFATLVWEACLACWSAITLLLGTELDASVLVPSVITGLMVSAAVSLFCPRCNKVRAIILGLLIGVVPCALGLLKGFMSAKGYIDAPVMWVGFGLWLLVPSCAGGALGAWACFDPARPVYGTNGRDV